MIAWYSSSGARFFKNNNPVRFELWMINLSFSYLWSFCKRVSENILILLLNLMSNIIFLSLDDFIAFSKLHILYVLLFNFICLSTLAKSYKAAIRRISLNMLFLLIYCVLVSSSYADVFIDYSSYGVIYKVSLWDNIISLSFVSLTSISI